MSANGIDFQNDESMAVGEDSFIEPFPKICYVFEMINPLDADGPSHRGIIGMLRVGNVHLVRGRIAMI